MLPLVLERTCVSARVRLRVYVSACVRLRESSGVLVYARHARPRCQQL